MIIGIGGISNSGKSKLAERLKEYYSNKKVIVLCQDNYAIPTAQIPKINGHTNWEIPESLDFDRFYNIILENEKTNDIVIAEGLFVFYNERFLELFDKKIFITIGKETFLKRKSADYRWGEEPDWYKEYIWESHQNYCKVYSNELFAFQVSAENPYEINELISYINY
jgi:uridine kinase